MADDSATPIPSSGHRSPHSLRDFFAAIEAGQSEAAANAVAAQQQAWVTAQAAQAMGIATLYALDTAAVDEATAEELRSAPDGSG